MINTFVNYFLLLLCAFLSHRSPRRLRLLGGAAMGGVMSLVILLPALHPLLSLGIKLLGAAVIVAISYRFETFKAFVRLLLSFLAANFLFAGAMLALELILHPRGMLYKNGTVYFDISLMTLVVLTAVCYAVVTLILRLTRSSAPNKSIGQVTITVDGKCSTASALLDTGNSLCDGFSGDPVIIAEYRAVKDLLPEALLPLVTACDLSCTVDTPWQSRVRLIPYGALGKDGLLPAFRPDSVTVKVDGKERSTSAVLVAVSPQSLSNGLYAVLLHPSII